MNKPSEEFHKNPDFVSFPEMMATRISRIQDFNRKKVYVIVLTRREHDENEEWNEYLKPDDKMTYAEERQKELIQEGLIYLLYAIRSYKPEGRKRLIRFAIKGIIEHMKMFVDRYERISNLDTKVSVTVKVNKLQTWEKSQSPLSRKEKIDELQIYKAVDCDDRDHYLSQLENLISGSGEEIVKENHISIRQKIDEELIHSEETQTQIEMIVSLFRKILDRRQQRILTQAFGIKHEEFNTTGEELSQTEIAKAMNLSRERIRQIKDKAILRFRRLFHPLYKNEKKLT